jgi:hypothetical protein
LKYFLIFFLLCIGIGHSILAQEVAESDLIGFWETEDAILYSDDEVEKSVFKEVMSKTKFYFEADHTGGIILYDRRGVPVKADGHWVFNPYTGILILKEKDEDGIIGTFKVTNKNDKYYFQFQEEELLVILTVVKKVSSNFL